MEIKSLRPYKPVSEGTLYLRAIFLPSWMQVDLSQRFRVSEWCLWLDNLQQVRGLPIYCIGVDTQLQCLGHNSNC